MKDETKYLKNKQMNSKVYELRREVIKLIYEAGKLVKLPRITVRITKDHKEILGVARPKKNIIWITENFVASRAVVFHEILHAVFGLKHIPKCPLMADKINPNLDVAVCNKLFCSHATNGEKPNE